MTSGFIPACHIVGRRDVNSSSQLEEQLYQAMSEMGPRDLLHAYCLVDLADMFVGNVSICTRSQKIVSGLKLRIKLKTGSI